MSEQNENKSWRRLAYTAGFFLNLSLAVSAYVNSSFIQRFVSEARVGLIYSLAAILSLLLALAVNRLTKSWGNKKILISLTVLNLAALFILNAYPDQPIALGALVAYLVLGYLISISLDLYLENVSANSITGGIRGIFLTFNNLAWLLSPLLASFLLQNGEYPRIYGFAGLMLVPFIYLLTRLRRVDPKNYQQISWHDTLQQFFHRPNQRELNIRKILWIDFLLNFFYAVMVIYLPIYLLNHVGLTWPQLGLIFTIMLLPFVILDFILGRLADKLWGEKEILTTGLIIMMLATAVIPFITSQSVWVWGLLLFFTRVGAASVEIMKETYLFKQISARDINTVFLSRNTYPLAHIIAPVIASVFIAFFNLQFFFLILGLIMLLGLPQSLSLRDTK